MKMTLVKEYPIAVSSTEDGIADIWYDEEEKNYYINGLDYFDCYEKVADTLEEAIEMCDKYSEEVVADDERRLAEMRAEENFNYAEWARQNYG